MIYNIISLICLIICLTSIKTEACSTFLLKKDHKVLLAKSYDWIAEDGLVIVNKRQIAKQAMGVNQPMQWISKYGSVIFTQAGRELPLGGINETGLAIELMWLDDTVYPHNDSRSTVYELQWIQYQLDTACSIQEVLESDKFLRIDRNSKAKVHFIVVDSTGHSAIIEFINGKMVVHDKNNMPVPVLTNDTYQKSLNFLNEHKGFGGDKTSKEGYESLDRFVRISTLLQEFSHSTSNADATSAFNILSSVANFNEVSDEKATFENMEEQIRTKWNIVYDISNKEISFLTGKHKKIRTIRLNALDFSGNTIPKVLDIEAKLSGDVSLNFIPYSYELNRKLIDRYFDKIPFLRDLSNKFKERTAKYPETTYYVGQ